MQGSVLLLFDLMFDIAVCMDSSVSQTTCNDTNVSCFGIFMQRMLISGFIEMLISIIKVIYRSIAYNVKYWCLKEGHWGKALSGGGFFKCMV